MVVSAVLEEDVGGWVLSGRQLDLALFLVSSVLWFLYHYSLATLFSRSVACFSLPRLLQVNFASKL